MKIKNEYGGRLNAGNFINSESTSQLEDENRSSQIDQYRNLISIKK